MSWVVGWMFGHGCCNSKIAPASYSGELVSGVVVAPEDVRKVREVKLIINENKMDKVVVSSLEDTLTVNILQTAIPEEMNVLEKTSPITWDLYHDRNIHGVMKYFAPLINSTIHRVDAIVFNDPARTIGPVLCNYYMLPNIHTVSITKTDVTAEELKFIRTFFPRIVRFRVLATLPREQMNFPLTYTEVKMLDGREITKDVLKEIKCERLEVQQTNLKVSELKELVYSWFKSECWTNLKSLVIHRVQGDISADKILEEYRTYTWRESRRGKWFVQDEKTVFDCGAEKDIKRVRDERAATVIFHRNTFRFYVWEKLLPKMPKNGFANLNRGSSSYMEY